MKVYIATKFENKRGFRSLKKMLEFKGHEVVHDWTKEDASKVDDGIREKYLCDCAVRDGIGVAVADCTILLARPKMAGAFVELGIAIALSKRIIIVGAYNKGNQDCIFYHFGQVPGLFEHVDSIEDAVKLLEPTSPPIGIQVPANN